MYFYEKLFKGESFTVSTLTKLSELTGINKDKISRGLSKTGYFYDKHGEWRIVSTEYKKTTSKHRPGSEFNFSKANK